MTGINSIDYSLWTNTAAKALAQQADTDDIKGLQGAEAFIFARNAKNSNIEQGEIYELLGLEMTNRSRAAKKTAKISRPKNPAFDRAVEYYNKEMNYSQRSSVTQLTYDNLTTMLYNLEHEIDEAYQECKAYTDDKIVIIPRSHLWYYRDYPYWDDRLINFDIEDLRTRTTEDMESLATLKQKVANIIGESDSYGHSNTEYNVDKLAIQTLGMSYAKFKSTYSKELDFCKTVTQADFSSMSETQRMVYDKARAYAREMLTITINEAHTVNWDTGELKLDETLKATGDMFAISDFEDKGITEQGLAGLQSGIMYKSFEEALISKHQEYDPTGITDVKVGNRTGKIIRRAVRGDVWTFHPDGSIFDGQGRKIK